MTHGGEPISVYCEAGADKVEVFVRDHGDGFDMNAIPEGRLGIRESIIGRIRRRGGTVESVSRPHWGTRCACTCRSQADGNRTSGAMPRTPAGSMDDRHPARHHTHARRGKHDSTGEAYGSGRQHKHRTDIRSGCEARGGR